MTTEILSVIPDKLTQKKALDPVSPETLNQQSCKVFHRGREDSPTASFQKDRKAQALKSNLAKRKQQQRARVNAASARPDQ